MIKIIIIWDAIGKKRRGTHRRHSNEILKILELQRKERYS